MHKCLYDKKYIAEKRKTRTAIPMKSFLKNKILTVEIHDLIEEEECLKLLEYVDLLFENINNRRRKKYALIYDREAANKLCSRYMPPFIKIIFNGKVCNYKHDSCCDEIEVIQWVPDMSLKNTQYNKITENKYVNIPEEYYIITYLVCIDNTGSTNTIVEAIADGDISEKICLNRQRSLIFDSRSAVTKEIMANHPRTQIYFHSKYKVIRESESESESKSQDNLLNSEVETSSPTTGSTE